MTITYPFTEAEMETAANVWGANCGPSALAFALQVPLNKVRRMIPGFEQKWYTSPSMMKAALKNMGRAFTIAHPEEGGDVRSLFDGMSLVRIQWAGPWTAPGANPKWACRHTHWIATYPHENVFDCNGGARSYQSWRAEIVPLLTQSVPRADGRWFPTHVWRIAP